MNSAHGHLTDCGLPGIKDIPYGVHMCHFYRNREELAGALVPYFAAGLRRRERCIWVTAEPLDALAAADRLRAAGLDADRFIQSGALVIRDYSTWYAKGDELKGNDVARLWLDEERKALAAGYSGLRITGNTSFVDHANWELFMEYEALLNPTFAGRRVVTLCSYDLNLCGAAEVLDVVRNHGCTLDRPDDGWQILTGRPASPRAPLPAA
jgi:two-component system, sensor histidine kinase PdtaS